MRLQLMRDAQAAENAGGGQESPEEKKGKLQNRFNGVINKIEAVLGKTLEKKIKRKVAGAELDNIITDLFKEEKEALAKEVKEDLKNLIIAYAAAHAEKEKKQKEMDQLWEAKMKELCEAGDKVLNKIDGLPEIEKRYKEGLGKIVTGS